jgi:ATP-dependent RNA helicase DeaD
VGPPAPEAPAAQVFTGTGFFGDIEVSAAVAHALSEMGYTQPTPIQALVTRPMIEGRDVVGQAQTGTGKTAGFGVPIVNIVDGDKLSVQALVLVPTRELAQQVSDEIARIAKYSHIEVVAVYGGAPLGSQVRALERGAQIVVGTPGRILDHLGRGTLNLGGVRILVLDEADQMLDIGFLPDIRRILRLTPRDRLTAMFSATVPAPIKRLAHSYLHDPEWLLAGEETRPVNEVEQVCYEVANQDKPEALAEVIQTHSGEQSLIFCRTQIAVDRVVRILRRKGHSIEGIHGGMPQGERNAVMGRFRSGEAKLLVSTNLTARGIDVPTVENVINYDIPESVEEYVHRIGRTARMGRPGTAITFLSEWDIEFYDAIESHIGADQIERRALALYRRG